MYKKSEKIETYYIIDSKNVLQSENLTRMSASQLRDNNFGITLRKEKKDEGMLIIHQNSQ